MPSSIDYTGRDVLDNDSADTSGEKFIFTFSAKSSFVLYKVTVVNNSKL